jgi:hypothetical protein
MHISVNCIQVFGLYVMKNVLTDAQFGLLLNLQKISKLSFNSYLSLAHIESVRQRLSNEAGGSVVLWCCIIPPFAFIKCS